MEILTTDKKGQLATRPANLGQMYPPTSSNPQPTKIAPNYDIWDYARQIIRDEYKNLVFAAKTAIKDENTLISNIDKICTWLKQAQRRPWCRLAGFIGNGKTTMLHALKSWYEKTHPRSIWNIYSANQLTRIATQDPEQFETIISKYPRLMIDDLGTEPNEVLVYGNKMQPIREMFYARYECKLITLYTTNLTDEQFTAYYGDRIADRCRELQLKIVFPQTSYRA